MIAEVHLAENFAVNRPRKCRTSVVEKFRVLQEGEMACIG
jgi:hypothetical protein